MPFRGLRRIVRRMGGGGSHHEVQRCIVDNTAQILAESKRQEEARLEEERLERERVEQERIAREAREAAERERQRFLAEQRRLEEEQQARERERQRQEHLRLERERQLQQQLANKSASKRQALRDYRLGDKMGIVRLSDTSDVKRLRIGVFGPTGSGKSCFINTCERTVRQTDKGSVPVATSGSEGTIILEDYLQELFFRLVDTRGFFSYDHHEGRELDNILFGRIRSGDCIQRSASEPATTLNDDAPFDCWLHGVILVVKANDIRLRNGTLEKYLKPVRETLKSMGISPVTVVTHRDTLTSDITCEQALDLASVATGSSRSHTCFVANYCPDHPGPDVNTELQIYNILSFALLNAEMYVKNAKQNRLQQIRGELLRAIESACAVTVPQAALVVFLDVMKTRYQWPESSIQQLSRDLHEEDVKTLQALASCWTDVKAMFPPEMRTTVEQDLDRMRMI